MSFIEKVGKKIPDPVIIFMILYAIVMIVSIFMGGMEFETLAADGGTISYEIYIIHPFILYIFEKETAEGKQVDNLEIVLWTIGLTLLLSSVLKVVQGNLVRKVRL